MADLKDSSVAHPATRQEIASSALDHEDSSELIYHRDDLLCVEKVLPERLQVKAALTATRINPANGLNFAAMASLAPSREVMNPLRIALLTAKYWGPQVSQLTVSFNGEHAGRPARAHRQPSECLEPLL